MPFVFDFDHKHRRPPMEMKDLLGGKGANLAEMTSVLGLPVPPGFTISTDACRAYMDGGWPEGLTAEVARARARLEKTMGKIIGDPSDPLLVSVRSGAKFSMPGMMDTVLNLGLNDQSVEGLAKQTGDERFAYDSYRRFVAMYGRIVLDIPGEEFDSLFDAAKELAGTTSDARVPTELLRYLVDSYQQIVERHTGEPFPQDPADQLRGAIEAVFRSWNGPRADRLPRARAHPPRPRARRSTSRRWCSATATTARAPASGFTRDPATGEQGRLRRLPGQRPGRGRGGRYPQHRAAVGTEVGVPEGPRRAARRSSTGSSATTATCATPSSPSSRASSGCSRPGWASAPVGPPCEMAVDMTTEPEIGLTRAEAVGRVTEDHLDSVLHPQFAGAGHKVLTKGLGASPGAAVGRAYFTADDAAAAAGRGEQVVLVRSETSPEDVHGMLAAEGILTARGGLVSHAAVVARGWGKPAVVGAEALRIGAPPGDRGRRDGGRGGLALPRRHRAARSWSGQVPAHRGRPAGRVRHPPGVGRRDPGRPPRRAGQRRQRRGRRQRPPPGGRGHRPVPDRAHVLGRGPPAGRAPDDPGRQPRRGAATPWRSCVGSSGRTSWRSWRPWTACR